MSFPSFGLIYTLLGEHIDLKLREGLYDMSCMHAWLNALSLYSGVELFGSLVPIMIAVIKVSRERRWHIKHAEGMCALWD